MPSEVDRYDVDPTDGAAQMKEWIRSLERRLSALEGQPFSGSQLTMKDTNGDVRARIGKLIGAGGTGERWGFEGVFQPGSDDWPGGLPFLRVSDDGAEFPYAMTAWIDPNIAPRAITSGTFVDVFATGIGLISHTMVGAVPEVGVDVGTTGEVRLRCTSSGVSSDAVALSSGLSGQVDIPPYEHGSTLWTGPIQFALQARRVSGGGNVNMYQPRIGLVYRPR